LAELEAHLNVFENILGAFQVGGALILSPLIRGWYNHWGATPEETSRTLPGDELNPTPMLGYTRAIDIQAPPGLVWPWLAQMGQGRGGLYSYDGLENLAKCDIHSVDRILPEHQNPQMGDLIRLGPQGYPCFAIMSIEPGRSLILVSADPQSGQPVVYTSQIRKGYAIATWQFILGSTGANTTRLLVRQRLSYSPEIAWVWRVTEPVGFVMERKMMLGIKQRAERNR
jgi:hypothetical protein